MEKFRRHPFNRLDALFNQILPYSVALQPSSGASAYSIGEGLGFLVPFGLRSRVVFQLLLDCVRVQSFSYVSSRVCTLRASRSTLPEEGRGQYCTEKDYALLYPDLRVGFAVGSC